MNQQTQGATAAGTWVRLHMESQGGHSSTMPSSIVGYLHSEPPGSYLLTKLLMEVEDEETGLIETVEVPQMRLVSRTYVWACDILGELPVDAQEGTYLYHGDTSEGGGLG